MISTIAPPPAQRQPLVFAFFFQSHRMHSLKVLAGLALKTYSSSLTYRPSERPNESHWLLGPLFAQLPSGYLICWSSNCCLLSSPLSSAQAPGAHAVLRKLSLGRELGIVGLPSLGDHSLAWPVTHCLQGVASCVYPSFRIIDCGRDSPVPVILSWPNAEVPSASFPASRHSLASGST